MVGAGLYDWLLLLHLLAAMVWVGGAVSLSVLAALVLRSRDPDSVARFVGYLRVVGPATLVPAMVAVLGFGIWLVIRSELWSFDQGWIGAAFALFAAAFLIGAIFLSQSGVAAQHAVEEGDHERAARELRRWSWGMRVILVLLVVVSWDMVIKPGV
jgi:uncharacterized membrane protein